MAAELRQQEQAGELTDEQLDRVAGGAMISDPYDEGTRGTEAGAGLGANELVAYVMTFGLYEINNIKYKY